MFMLCASHKTEILEALIPERMIRENISSLKSAEK